MPQLLGRVDSLALVFEYRPGRLLSRSLRGTLPDAFLPELEAACGSVPASAATRCAAGGDDALFYVDY